MLRDHDVARIYNYSLGQLILSAERKGGVIWNLEIMKRYICRLQVL